VGVHACGWEGHAGWVKWVKWAASAGPILLVRLPPPGPPADFWLSCTATTGDRVARVEVAAAEIARGFAQGSGGGDDGSMGWGALLHSRGAGYRGAALQRPSATEEQATATSTGEPEPEPELEPELEPEPELAPGGREAASVAGGHVVVSLDTQTAAQRARPCQVVAARRPLALVGQQVMVYHHRPAISPWGSWRRESGMQRAEVLAYLPQKGRHVLQWLPDPVVACSDEQLQLCDLTEVTAICEGVSTVCEPRAVLAPLGTHTVCGRHSRRWPHPPDHSGRELGVFLHLDGLLRRKVVVVPRLSARRAQSVSPTSTWRSSAGPSIE
jgi:hypothetical protein